MNTEAQERTEEARLEKRREEARMEHERGKVAAEIIASQARQIEQDAAFRRAALELLEAVEEWELDDATIGFAMDRAQIEELLAAARALRQVVGEGNR